MDTLKERGLAKGASLDNAVLVTSQKALNKRGLYFSDEFVRHKILDLIGDIALLGRPLHAHIVAIRTGHDMQLRLLRRSKQLRKPATMKGDRIMIDIAKIMKALPTRHPFSTRRPHLVE